MKPRSFLNKTILGNSYSHICNGQEMDMVRLDCWVSNFFNGHVMVMAYFPLNVSYFFIKQPSLCAYAKAMYG